MIVRDMNEMKGTDRAVSDAQWTSYRMLLADDKMGFSFHITVLEAGSEHTFHYKNHFESVYCMKGKGSITDHATGETHEIKPGVMYGLNPPVTGKEVHLPDGSYAAAEDLEKAD